MPRPANPATPTAAQRQAAYRERHGLRRVPLDRQSDADLATLRHPAETDRAALGRVLREAVKRLCLTPQRSGE